MSSDYTYPWQQELLKAFDPDGDVDNVGLYNKFRASDQDHTMTQNSPISVSQNAQLVDGLAVLHGLPSDLKKAALEGRASRLLFRRGFTPTTMLSRAQDAIIRPQIYVNILCDSNGTPATIKQGRTIIKYMRIYLEDLEETDVTYGNNKATKAMRRRVQPSDVSPIIAQIEMAVTSGFGKHTLSTKVSSRASNAFRKYVHSKNDYLKTKAWVDKFEKMLDEATQAGTTDDQPIPFNVCDVGWTYKPQSRRYDHGAHTSSICFMNLVDAICAALLSVSGIRIRYRTVQDLTDPVHVAIAEHLNSRLFGSYIFNGGFNVKVAGISTSSKDKIDPHTWYQMEVDVARRGIYITNVTREHDSRKKELKDLKNSIKAAKLIEVNKTRREEARKRQDKLAEQEKECMEKKKEFSEAWEGKQPDLIEFAEGREEIRAITTGLRALRLKFGELQAAMEHELNYAARLRARSQSRSQSQSQSQSRADSEVDD